MVFWQDLRYSLRALCKSPGFTATAVLSLALGIGANTAIFSLVDVLLLRSLPVRDPGSLAIVSDTERRGQPGYYSYPEYAELRDRNEVFSALVARFPTRVHLRIGAETERVQGDLVSGNYYQELGVNAILGRTITPEDDRTPGAHPVAMITYGLWQRKFGADPAVIGKTIRVNNQPLTVIGVEPARFYGLTVGEAVEVRIPLMMASVAMPGWGADMLADKRATWLRMMGRLKPGVSFRQAEAALNVQFQHIRESTAGVVKFRSEQDRKRFLARRVGADPGGLGFPFHRLRFSEPLVVLMAATGVVLLIACANVANLLLARAAVRRKEIAVRQALGAGRGRLVRQWMAESLLVALGGGALGVLWALAGSNALAAAALSGTLLPRLHVSPDLRILGFTLAVSLVTALLFGLAPALRASRLEIAPVLKDEGGALAGGTSHLALRKALIIAQVALTVPLLAGAGLFVRTLRTLENRDSGMDRSHVVQLRVDPSLNGYKTPQTLEFFRRLVERAETLHGARSAGLAYNGPFNPFAGAGDYFRVWVEGYSAPAGEEVRVSADAVSSRLFETLDIPLLYGRMWTPAEEQGRAKLAVVSQSFARHFFGAGNPIGRRLGTAPDRFNTEIVGVVRDVEYASLRGSSRRFLYFPWTAWAGDQMTLYLRAAGDPAKMVPAVRKEVRAMDPNLPVFDVRTLDEQVANSLARERLMAWLSGFFGVLAALLAAVGLYGVISYSVLQRTREIGVRVALGADRSQILWLVMRGVLTLAAAGLAIGVPAALILSRLISSMLFGVSPADALSMAGAALLMSAVAVLAGLLPAWRAARGDPMVALRQS